MSIEEYRSRHRKAFLQKQQQENSVSSNAIGSVRAEGPELMASSKSQQRSYSQNLINRQQQSSCSDSSTPVGSDNSSNRRSTSLISSTFPGSPLQTDRHLHPRVRVGPTDSQQRQPLSAPSCSSGILNSLESSRAFQSPSSSTSVPPHASCRASIQSEQSHATFTGASNQLDPTDETASDALLALLLSEQEKQPALDEEIDEASAAVIAKLVADDHDMSRGDPMLEDSNGVRIPDTAFQEQLITDYNHVTPGTPTTRTVNEVLADQELARRLQEEEFLRDPVDSLLVAGINQE